MPANLAADIGRAFARLPAERVAAIIAPVKAVPLGYLAHKSGWFPMPLAVLLVVAGGCYLVDLLTAFLVPDLNQLIHTFIVIPCALPEIWMVGYLPTIGAKTDKIVKPGEPVLAPA